jgi:hypothetical protein
MEVVGMSPRQWMEKRVQWSSPRDDTGTYPQPTAGAPYIIFAACILPGYRPDDIKIDNIPPGYCVYISMCSHYTVMAAESVHKRRMTRLKNIVAKKSAGMPPFIRAEIDRLERQKKDPDYFDPQTCVETQKARQWALNEMVQRWTEELMESMEQLDKYPELKIKAVA